MRGALKVTYVDGKDDFFEVDPVGNDPDFVANMQAFPDRPHVTLILDEEILVIPSTSIRSITISRTADLDDERLAELPGVLPAVRVLG